MLLEAYPARMTEPAATLPVSPPRRGAAGRPARRSPALGIVALVLVPVVVALTLLAPLLLAPILPRTTDLQLLGLVLTGEVLGMAVVLVLGLVAAVTRRGRVPGVIAAVLALLLNPFALSLVLGLVRLGTPAG